MNNNTINNDIYRAALNNFYTIDGINNNLHNPNYGSVSSQLLNIAPIAYGDGISSSAGANRTNARIISNGLAQQNELITSDRGLTNFIWAFGQFVDHDVILTPENHDAPVAIPVPLGDPNLDPNGTGTVIIPLDSTAFSDGTGTDLNNPAQIENKITAWLDGSNIYGSDQERNAYLRAFAGGKLNLSDGNLLPFGSDTFDNANPSRQNPNELFAAGDIRANENSVLLSMHTLFVREHNRIADELAIAHPDWNDDQLYNRARQINIAQYQSIVYNEYLPALLGNDLLPAYSGYDSTINPNIARCFGSAGFRVGHTQISSQILRLDAEGQEIAEGNLALRDVFFRSVGVIQESGIDPILRGIGSSLSQNVDLKIIDDLRNLLFKFDSQDIGRDLFAINIERGRLNGVSDYNTVRESFGLPKVTSFAEISSDVEIQTQLESLYGNVDNIDLYVGLLAEDRESGSAVGETFQAIIGQQFVALRDGDRFYYENIFTPEEISEIDNTTLADIVRLNTDTTIIQDNAFSLLNEGTAADDVLNGGLGQDTIFGGAGSDVISGFQGDDLLYGGEGDDLLLGYEGKDLLDGGTGDDAFQLDLSARGAEIYDADGFDYLFLTTNDVELNNDNSFGAGEIAIAAPAAGTIGLAKEGKDLILDINRDGVAEASEDLKINDFFSSTGEAGTGLIEGINNVFGADIIDYFVSEQAPTVHRFFRADVGSHFYTASEVEKQSIIDNLPQYAYEGESYNAVSTAEGDDITGAKPVYRFFNQSTGVHLYTISEIEKNYVTDNLDNYTFENVAYYAYDTPQEDTIPLYRFYQTQGDFHFYTPSVNEKDYVVENLPHYQLEGDAGVAFYVQPLL